VSEWHRYLARMLARVEIAMRMVDGLRARAVREAEAHAHLVDALEHARRALRAGPRDPEREALEEVIACERAVLEAAIAVCSTRLLMGEWLDLAEQYAREYAALPATQPDA
jgi:hypothetical protein